ncbi:TonB-dependent receptor [Paucibacter sp. B2R-40]|uniref:TonB-dependent receptor n=1 Tax=Paucibacter sp. B2R-40 TaxID=2893554 RepID=UPI0021E46C6C|nr:TonB-dependent receptor [Paucibacter sp. B2R-40]MCV2353832.1 TonB-dependent receptor [Paucibacter sp. B2R-40]
MYSHIFSRRALALGASLLCLSMSTWAQQQDAVAASVSEPGQSEKLGKVVLTGNPLRSQELAQPSNVLEGDALILRRGSTLGETLEGLPGLSSSYFGPNSNRPTIRGLDGDRVRMLSNSGASVDASSLSFDHAVPLDPLVIDRIEVLRGAAALLYGGNAIGGVVNTIDNRIPRQAQVGLSGASELRLGGAAAERNGAIVLEGGDKRLVWHADASARRADDLRVPSFTADGVTAQSVRNSASDSHGGALGASLLFANGYAGLSVDDSRNNYGVTVEPDVTVQMQRQRLSAAGEWRVDAQGSPQASGALLQRLTWSMGSTRYEHREVEGTGAVGTVFKSTGKDLRIELAHAPLGSLQGVVGLQWEDSDFSALGAEALVPSTSTRNGAVFVLEQFSSGPLALSAGARLESVRVDSRGDEASTGEEARFGAATRHSFSPHSLSLGGSYKLLGEAGGSKSATSKGLNLTANLNSTERAPMFYELHANGVHVASGAFERGDAHLRTESALGLDLGLVWQGSQQMLRLNVFRTKFSRYIALDATGVQIETDGQSLPEYAFKSVPALMQGFELEGRFDLPELLAGVQLSLTAQLDGVRGENRETGEALPRLAPLRASLGLDAQQGLWSGRFELRMAARQDRVPALDSPTAGYGLVKLSLARQFRLADVDGLWYLKLDNLGNKLAYSASSVATIRDLSPLPGRSVHTGVQVRF